METIVIIYSVMFFFGIYFLLMFILLYYRNKSALYNYPKPSRFPTVSFIVPAYNEEENIGETIKSLINLDYPPGKKEIIVVNDGSKDKTAEIVNGFVNKFKEVRILNKQNSGKADSINQALKIVKGELVAITDADSYPEKDSLIKMVGYFEEDEKVAAVTSRVLVKNRNNFIERYQHIDYIVIAWSRKILDFIDCVYVTNGPLSIYRTEVIKKVGGFDTKNLTEDIEITWNLLSRGYKTRMSYSTTVYTNVPSKFDRWNKQRIRWNLGGLQTLWKYRKFALRGENLFGYFIIIYVTLSFFLALIGFALFARHIFKTSIIYILSVPYFFKGYNPFKFLDFSISVTFLALLGVIFFILAVLFHKISLEGFDKKSKSILSILIYMIVYRALYIIPLLFSLYKLAKKEIGWYTK